VRDLDCILNFFAAAAAADAASSSAAGCNEKITRIADAVATATATATSSSNIKQHGSNIPNNQQQAMNNH